MPPFESFASRCAGLFSFELPLKRQESNPEFCHFSRVSDDVLSDVLLQKLNARDLCVLGQVSQRFKLLAGSEARWKQLYKIQFGDPTALTEAARTLAGSWRGLVASKTVTTKESAPWNKPCEFELRAVMESMTQQKRLNPSKELAAVFLVDGSGSVNEDDFTCMTSFITRASQAILDTAADSKVGVVQFSNDVRVEVPLQSLDMPSFEDLMVDMLRMNGGTNIALAIQKAGSLLKKGAAEDALRLVVLLTDGRVDSQQGRAAKEMADRLVDEQSSVMFYAFGVGHGVDHLEMIRIIGASGRKDAADRYVDLRTRDDGHFD